MNAAAMVFLVMLVPNTPKPVLALMASYDTVKECNAVLAQAPKEQKDKWACIEINMKPQSEGVKL